MSEAQHEAPGATPEAAVAIDAPTPRAKAPAGAAPRANAALRAKLAELARFVSVGGVAFVVDLGLFNLLRFGPGRLLEDKPVTAKVISLVVATAVSWLGNRHWTFAEQRTAPRGPQFAAFVALNVLGALVPVGTLALSHYAFGQASPLADNVSTVVGIALATVLRYVGYKKWVFTG